MSDLIVVDSVKAIDVFGGGGLDGLLDQITKEAKTLVPDLSTAKGRKEIASMANKVARSKTYLDGLGKDLVSEKKKAILVVDKDRKKMRDSLDVLKAEVRQPLTEWEAVEDERIRLHQEAIQYMLDSASRVAEDWMDLPASGIEALVNSIGDMAIDDSWEEFANEASKAKDKAMTGLLGTLDKRQKYDAEQKELARLREESELQAQKDREEQLRREGEERAKKEAEDKALALEVARERELEAERKVQEDIRLKGERDRLAAVEAQQEAERRAKQAEESSTREAEAAAQRERDRIDDERIAEELAAKKREADKTHKAKINNAVLKALMTAGLSKDQGVMAITAIAKGQIPHVKISY